MSNILNNRLTTNIEVISDYIGTAKNNLHKHVEIGRTCFARVFSGESEFLSPDNLIILSFFSHLSIDEIITIEDKDLLMKRMVRRKDWAFKTLNELHLLIEKDIAENWHEEQNSSNLKILTNSEAKKISEL